MPDRGRLLAVFMVVFIGLLGFSLMIPLLPFYAEEFGANPTTQGLLIASYAIAQLIGAPILGRLSDRFGRRPILLVSVFGTFLSLIFIGFANSLLILFLGRILDGLTGGNISVAGAYMTDITDEKNRARGLGLIGMAFAFGFIIGPALGGILSEVGTRFVEPALAAGGSSFLRRLNWTYSLPAFVAAAIGFINLVQIIFQLPESLPPERRGQTSPVTQTRRGVFAFGQVFEMLLRPKVGPLLNLRFFFGYAFALLQTVFPIYANKQLGLTPAQTAFTLTYVGVGSAIVQGWAIGKLTDRYRDARLLLAACVLMSPGLLGWGLAGNVPVLLLSFVPIIIGGGIFNTIIDTALTKAVGPDEAGGVLGVSASLESSTRAIAPSTGGVMIQLFGSWSPGVLGAGIVAAMTVYAYNAILNGKRSVTSSTPEVGEA